MRHWSNKPKEYRNSNDMMGCFLRTGFVWVRHVNKSHNFDPGRRLGDKCKEQLADPPKNSYGWRHPPQNLFWSNSHFLKDRRRLWDQRTELFGEHPKKNLLGGESHLLQRAQEDKRAMPQDLYRVLGKNPK